MAIKSKRLVAILLLQLTIIMWTKGNERTVFREHDFYTVETIIDTEPMRKALIRITSKIKSTWQFDKYKVTGRDYIMKDLHKRTELTRKQLSLINQDDFILTDLVGRVGKHTKGMDRQRVDLR
jgi:hypothetical protein